MPNKGFGTISLQQMLYAMFVALTSVAFPFAANQIAAHKNKCHMKQSEQGGHAQMSWEPSLITHVAWWCVHLAVKPEPK